MSRKRVLLFLAVFLQLRLFSPANGNDPGFIRLMPRDRITGTVMPRVHSLAQDKQGFIWLTTDSGLVRYDGRNFISFRHDPARPDSLSADFLFSVFEDSRGILWVTSDAGLNRFDRSTGTFVRYVHDPADPGSLPSDHIRAIGEDAGDGIWVGTKSAGLGCLDPETGRFKTFAHDPRNSNSPGHDSIWAVCRGRDGRMWFGTHGAGLDSFDPKSGTWEHYPARPEDPQGLSDENIWVIREDPAGKLWLGTNRGGLCRFDPGTRRFSRIHLKPEAEAKRADPTILALDCANENEVWIGTADAGVFRCDSSGDRLVHYGFDSITSMFRDRSGVLWFGTDNGLSLLNDTRGRFPAVLLKAESPGGEDAGEVLCLYDDGRGRTFIGTSSGDLTVRTGREGRGDRIALRPGENGRRNAPRVTAILPGENGTLWLGTDESGLVHYDIARRRAVFHRKTNLRPDILPSNQITCLAWGRDSRIWGGTSRHGLFAFDPKSGKSQGYLSDASSSPGIAGNYAINALIVDRDGVVWTGTEWHGVDEFDPASGSWTHHRSAEDGSTGPAHNTISALVEDGKGDIWAGTASGLSRFDRRARSWTSTFRNLPEARIYALLADAEGRLWFTTPDALHVFDPESTRVRSYDAGDGLSAGSFKPGIGFKSGAGELFFGGQGGFIRFFPRDAPADRIAPAVAFAAYQARPHPAPVPVFDESPRAVRLRRGDMPLRIEAADLSFAASGKRVFRFEAKQKGLVVASGESDLPEWALEGAGAGRYDVTVLAVNADGLPSPRPARLIIAVVTPFAESRVFWAVLLLLATAGLGIVYRRRKRKWLRHLRTDVQDGIEPFCERYGITKREREVIVLVLKGKTNKEIERQLFISERTVKAHLYNVFQKAGVKNRLQLANLIQESLRK